MSLKNFSVWVRVPQWVPIMNYDDIEADKFNNKFWEWFDDLPIDNRKKFMYYPLDMAKLYFFNKEWRYIKDDRN